MSPSNTQQAAGITCVELSSFSLTEKSSKLSTPQQDICKEIQLKQFVIQHYETNQYKYNEGFFSVDCLESTHQLDKIRNRPIFTLNCHMPYGN